MAWSWERGEDQGPVSAEREQKPGVIDGEAKATWDPGTGWNNRRLGLWYSRMLGSHTSFQQAEPW